jgi:hypothetical protein
VNAARRAAPRRSSLVSAVAGAFTARVVFFSRGCSGNGTRLFFLEGGAAPVDRRRLDGKGFINWVLGKIIARS